MTKAEAELYRARIGRLGRAVFITELVRENPQGWGVRLSSGPLLSTTEEADQWLLEHGPTPTRHG